MDFSKLIKLNESKTFPLTLWRLGTDYLSECYPIDDKILKIISNGRAGFDLTYYKHAGAPNDKAIDHILEFDNDWFLYNPQIAKHLEEDLWKLIDKKMFGAYTILACIQSEPEKRNEYFKIAAEYGIPSGMVSYGIFLNLADEREEGVYWISKGADAGDEIGQLQMGISHEFGVMTPLDYEKAIYWYRRALKENRNSYAANNMGVLYLWVGYYKTALKLFEKAINLRKKDNWKNYPEDDVNKIQDNLYICETICKAPAERRPLMIVLQQHRSNLDDVFRPHWAEQEAPKSFFDDSKDDIPQWEPSLDNEEIQDELRQRKFNAFIDKIFQRNSTPEKPIVENKNKVDQFVSVKVRMTKDAFNPNQHELIFFEKRVHGQLNQYLAAHCMQIDSQFRTKGFFLTYLPSQMNHFLDPDVVDYLIEDLSLNFKYILETKRQSDIKSYWNSILESSLLPEDCAGFLRYNYESSLQEKAIIFDYIMIPFQTDIDFKYMFDALTQYLSNVPLVNLSPSSFSERESSATVSATSTLTIEEDYSIWIKDSNNDKSEVKMPILAKVLFLTFINHPEGIVLKLLPEYYDELMRLYTLLSKRIVKPESIDRLIDTTSNSANEQISRIRKAFKEALKDKAIEADYFTPQGIPGDVYSIAIPREHIENHIKS